MWWHSATPELNYVVIDKICKPLKIYFMSNTHKDKNKDKRHEHIERRREHGLTYRELGEDFGISKSKIHRDINHAMKEKRDSES